MPWFLVAWLLSVTSGPSDPALAARILSLTRAFFAADSQGQEDAVAADIRRLFAERGLQPASVVGDEAAYDFVLLNCSGGPVDARQIVLAKVRAMKRALPADAVAYCEARLRQDQLKARSTATPPTHPDVRDRLNTMFVSDQAVRQQHTFDVAKMVQADREHEPVLREIFRMYGVPTYRMVGPEAAGAFATMVQHQSAAFRRDVLPKLRAAVDAGQADPTEYANMADRARRDAGRDQFYGQNLECSSDNPVLHETPIENARDVRMRRARLGLFRLDLYVRLVLEHSPNLCSDKK